MNIKKLALLGGKPLIRKSQLKPYKSLSTDELKAVGDVVKSNCLSGFYGSWEDGFLGGPKVKLFEKKWSDIFKSKFSITVNSNTSGLYAAVGAVGVSPGDEVIVPCTTMSATAMAPLIYGGIPVFADIDPDTFCIDVNEVKSLINKKTKAIIAVNLFGHPAELKKLKKIAKQNKIFLIEDNAQAPLAAENNKFTGTVGDIGVFSLNYHKHIHTGEGGVCTTNNTELATRLQMIRNHAEAVVGPAKVKSLKNMVGFNYRMTELSAAVGLVQLKNIKKHVGKRKSFAEKLSSSLSDIDGLNVPIVRKNCEHVYYNWALKFDKKKLGISRHTFVKALNAEGYQCSEGYVQPLYNLPIFKKMIAFGENGYPFKNTKVTYHDNMCKNAEELYKEELIITETCPFDLNPNIIKEFVNIFHKVLDNLDSLRDFEIRKN